MAKGELLGIVSDTIVMLVAARDPDHGHRRMRSVWYRDVESIVLANEASAWVNGTVGLLAGAAGGVASGVLIVTLAAGEKIDGLIRAHGGIMGGILGVIVGLIFGISSGSHKTIWMEDDDALPDLNEFSRFRLERDVRNFRGY